MWVSRSNYLGSVLRNEDAGFSDWQRTLGQHIITDNFEYASLKQTQPDQVSLNNTNLALSLLLSLSNYNYTMLSQLLKVF